MKYLKYILSIILIISSFQLITNKKNITILKVDNESNIIDLKTPSIITKNNISTFTALIINNSDKQIYINNIQILIKDSEKNIICTFQIDINKSLTSDENIKIQKDVNYDLSDATSFDYIVN